MRNLMVILATIAALSSLACPGPTPTPILPLAPLTITLELEVKSDPREAADFVLNPKPISGDRYLQGRTVTIDVLPKEGWRIEQWIGPVFGIVGETAKINMNSSQTVVVRLVRLEKPILEKPITVTAPEKPITVTAPKKPITVTAPEKPITVTAPEKPITVTVPEPSYDVHVDSIVDFYDMFDGNSDVIYLVEVFDSAGNPVSGARVIMEVLEPTGSPFRIEGETDRFGEAYLEYNTTSIGVHGFAVMEITGPDFEYNSARDREPAASSQLVPVFKDVAVEKDVIRTRIPVTWSNDSELDEGVVFLYAAPDLEPWIISFEESDEAEVVGFLAAVIPVPEDEGPVTASFLEDFFEEDDAPSNCAELLEREDFYDNGAELSGIELRFECDGEGIFVISLWFDPINPYSALVIAARLMTREDIEYFDLIVENLEWEPIPSYDLATTTLPADGGTVTGAGTFAAGSQVSLQAIPNSGWSFASWSGACFGTGDCSVTMDSDKTVTARFVQQQYSITATADPSNGGTVTGAGAFVAGSRVILQATPNSGWRFAGWSGACFGTAPCTVTVNSNKTVTARFVQQQYSLTATANPSNGGTVTGAGAFVAGSRVFLQAIPNSSWVFAGWSGACSGTGSCSVTLDSNKTVTARFVQQQYRLTATANPSNGGSVTGAGTFVAGSRVSLQANRNSGWSFAGWSGACSGTGACSVTMDSNKTVTARFVQEQYRITATANPSNGGSVTGAGTFVAGSRVSLQANRNSGWVFAGWSGACSGTSSCSVTMDSNKTVTASFTLLPPLRLQTPSGTIPEFNATVTSLKFYESPTGGTPRAERVYRSSFDQSLARFIAWELNLTHPRAGRRIGFIVDYVYYRPDGSIFFESSRTKYIEANLTSSAPAHLIGWADLGNWKVGTYRVELAVRGLLVAREWFEVTGSVAPPPPPLGGWTTKAPVPLASNGPSVVAINGLVYVVSGWNGSHRNNLYAYNPATNTWSAKAPSPIIGNGRAHGVINGILYEAGGVNCCVTINTVFAYDPATDTWSIKASMPTKRQSAAGGVIAGKLYVAGGVKLPASGFIFDVLANLEAYDPVSNSWTTLAAMPTARSMAGAGVVNGILYVIGGAIDSTTTVAVATVEAYNPTTNTWSTKAPMPSSRLQVGVAVVGNILYAFGGHDASGNHLTTVEAYDPASNTWSTKAAMPTPRSYFGVAEVNGTIYAIGGDDSVRVLDTNEAFAP